MEENKKIKINEIEIKTKFFWNRAIRAVHVFFNRSWSWKHCRRSQPTERFKNVSCGLTYRYFSLGRLFKIAFGRLFEKLSGRIRKVNFSWPRILENKELAYANHCQWKCDGGIRSVRRKNSTAVSCQNFFLFPSCPTRNKNLESLQIFLSSETGSPDGKFAFLLRTPGTVHM